MWALLFYFTAIGFGPLVGEGLPAAPVDIEVGRQTVELRKPLIARRPGARLILYIRDPSALGVRRGSAISDFETAIPMGSMVAYLSDGDDRRLTLEHSAYSYYRGYSGLVLTAASSNSHMDRYRRLELDAKIPLKGVRFVWLNSEGRRVEDVAPAL